MTRFAGAPIINRPVTSESPAGKVAVPDKASRSRPLQRPWWQRVLLSAWVRPVLLVLILLVVWDLSIRLFLIPPYLIPTP